MNATDSILRLGSRFGVLMLIAGAILWDISLWRQDWIEYAASETLFLHGLRDPYSAFFVMAAVLCSSYSAAI